MLDKPRILRFIKFGIVGSTGIVVNNGILYTLVTFFHFPTFLASPIAIATAIFNNFSWNDLWTWGENRTQRKFGYFHRLFRYYLSSFLGASINYGVLMIMIYQFHLPLILSNLVGIACGMFFNFLLGEFWVFQNKRP